LTLLSLPEGLRPGAFRAAGWEPFCSVGA